MTQKEILTTLIECAKGHSLFNGTDINFCYLAELSEALLDKNLDSAISYMAMVDWAKFVSLKNNIWRFKLNLTAREEYYLDAIASEQVCLPFIEGKADSVREIDKGYFNTNIVHEHFFGPANVDIIPVHQPLAIIVDMVAGLFISDYINYYRCDKSIGRIHFDYIDLKAKATMALKQVDNRGLLFLLVISFFRNMQNIVERTYCAIDKSFNQMKGYAQSGFQYDVLKFSDIIDWIFTYFHDNKTNKLNIFKNEVTKGDLLLALNLNKYIDGVCDRKQKAALAMISVIKSHYDLDAAYLNNWYKEVPAYLGISGSTVEKHRGKGEVSNLWKTVLQEFRLHIVSRGLISKFGLFKEKTNHMVE